jgi:hypothetical protein
MKYIIVKGWMGFGDRLQSLKMCVKFAIANNRKIYVDWTDSTWSHGNESFYTYFDLVGIPTIKSLSEIPENADIFPKFWIDKLDKPLSDEILRTSLNEIVLANKCYLNDDYYPQVLVYPCIDHRWVYSDNAFFGNVFRVVDKTIIEKVKDRQTRYGLANKVGVHLRGTDRANYVDKSQRIRGINIRMVSAGLLGGGKFVAVSDDAEYCKLWTSKFPQFPLVTEVGNLGGAEGVHNKAKGEISTSKHALNVDSLVDFFTLASCYTVISTSKDSRFAQEAMRLHKHVGQIIGS